MRKDGIDSGGNEGREDTGEPVTLCLIHGFDFGRSCNRWPLRLWLSYGCAGVSATLCPNAFLFFWILREDMVYLVYPGRWIRVVGFPLVISLLFPIYILFVRVCRMPIEKTAWIAFLSQQERRCYIGVVAGYAVKRVGGTRVSCKQSRSSHSSNRKVERSMLVFVQNRVQ